MKLSVEDVCRLIEYDFDTGEFYRLPSITSNGRKRRGGIVKNTPSAIGYLYINVLSFPHLAHRLAFVLMTGAWPEFDIDHINGNRMDNRWINLRPASRSQNHMNRCVGTANKSGHKGVSFCRQTGLWRATITVKRKQTSLGRHLTLEAASAAYANAVAEHHGEFARIT